MKTIQIKLTQSEIEFAENDFGVPHHTRGFADYFRIFWKTHREKIKHEQEVKKETNEFLIKCARILMDCELPQQKKSELIDEMNALLFKATGNRQTQIIF